MAPSAAYGRVHGRDQQQAGAIAGLLREIPADPIVRSCLILADPADAVAEFQLARSRGESEASRLGRVEGFDQSADPPPESEGRRDVAIAQPMCGTGVEARCRQGLARGLEVARHERGQLAAPVGMQALDRQCGRTVGTLAALPKL